MSKTFPREEGNPLSLPFFPAIIARSPLKLERIEEESIFIIANSALPTANRRCVCAPHKETLTNFPVERINQPRRRDAMRYRRTNPRFHVRDSSSDAICLSIRARFGPLKLISGIDHHYPPMTPKRIQKVRGMFKWKVGDE